MSVLRLGLAVILLLALSLTVLGWAGVRITRQAVTAVVRAAVQLSIVALVIAWIFTHPVAMAPYLAVMLVAATLTATRRIGLGRRTAPAVATALVVGPGLAVALALASGALATTSQVVLPFTAQVIGGSMIACGLAGGRLHDDAADQWGQVEGWLALGGTPRQAVADLGRRAVARALTPSIDQTRSAGLVTLPGAFVGMLLGGASPWQAAQLQLLVLVALFAAQAVATVITVQLLAPLVGRRQPVTSGA
ncbi:putative ABC transport system permease protein [Sanguibacter gelidistatuariae]|uniref:Putative ABC transport system permease protein n=1 Tax=Sanguibacter gelidistatuariae TaxID=1814289 RepID=A0A1G6MVP1_9MICO|nr:ABC transporter permease [Sanguibacter gelidistatuariae]SDC59046.1 putative ABC transport system permease protein [Sanguibacter gelidistatuariae]